MKLLIGKKALLLSALSLLGSASAVVMTNTQGINLPTFLQSGVPTQVVVGKHQANEEKSYILQGLGADALVAAVHNVGGLVSREFPIINAISALLTNDQVFRLGTNASLRITEDRTVVTTSKGYGKVVDDTYSAVQSNASLLHDMGIKGNNITVVLLDSGTLLGGKGAHLLELSNGQTRRFMKYNAITGVKNRTLNDDENGHGSHLASIINSSLVDENGHYNGMAPDINLISIKAFDQNGQGNYSQVLDGLNWVYMNKSRYKIRVINLSLGAEVKSTYWNDPINQAVMRLWEAGIVVVTSAGNNGGDLGTVSVPGNNPYVITVGAVTDNYTPYDYSDDRVATFSSRGPTFEGFVKPEIVAFGARIKAKFDGELVATTFLDKDDALDYYAASGTSQAAAVITGTVALMLQIDPHATPDDIKCRLMSTANAGFDNNSSDNPFVQGAGLVDAYKAAMSTATGCANTGLDISADLAGISHFRGPTFVDQNGELFIGLGAGNVFSESTGWGVSNESTGWGVSNESTGWGVSNESTGWGVFNESTGWGVSNESTGWGVSNESTGWGIYNESTGWGVANESTGWGVSNESTGWGVFNESTGWGVTNESTVSIESLGGNVNIGTVVLGEVFVWDETVLTGEDLEWNDVDPTTVVESQGN